MGIARKMTEIKTSDVNEIFDLIFTLSESLNGVNNGELVKNNQFSVIVTSEVEKSNFYRDLEQVIEWEDSTINISKNSISPRKL